MDIFDTIRALYVPSRLHMTMINGRSCVSLRGCSGVAMKQMQLDIDRGFVMTCAQLERDRSSARISRARSTRYSRPTRRVRHTRLSSISVSTQDSDSCELGSIPRTTSLFCPSSLASGKGTQAGQQAGGQERPHIASLQGYIHQRNQHACDFRSAVRRGERLTVRLCLIKLGSPQQRLIAADGSLSLTRK